MKSILVSFLPSSHFQINIAISLFCPRNGLRNAFQSYNHSHVELWLDWQRRRGLTNFTRYSCSQPLQPSIGCKVVAACVLTAGKLPRNRRIRATMKDQFPGNRTSSRFPLSFRMRRYIASSLEFDRNSRVALKRSSKLFLISPLTFLTSTHRSSSTSYPLTIILA